MGDLGSVHMVGMFKPMPGFRAGTIAGKLASLSDDSVNPGVTQRMTVVWVCEGTHAENFWIFLGSVFTQVAAVYSFHRLVRVSSRCQGAWPSRRCSRIVAFSVSLIV